MLRRRVHVLVALAVIAAEIGCTRPTRRRRQKLTLYCSAHFDWCELVKLEFSRDTGIKVSMVRKSSGEAYAQIWAERKNPKGDVWWAGTGDSHLQAAEAGLSEPYRSPKLAELHPWAVDPAGQGEHRTTGVYMGALGFGYNAEWLAKKGVPPPTGWRDLLSPAYAGEIQMANPNSSGTAYTALATLVQMMGEEDGFQYLRDLHRNISQYTKSGSAPVRAAARGEAGIAIVFLHDAVTQKAAGFPIEIVTPSEGTGFEVGCVSVIRGARHLEAARAFVDWSLSARAQNLAVQVPMFQVPSNRTATVSADTPRMDAIRLIDFDVRRFASAAERKRLLHRWDDEVRTAPR